jgi:large conductance mechanosensitive channel
MPSLPPAVRTFLAARPTDLRKSFDPLAAIVREGLRGDLVSGDVLVFRNKASDRIQPPTPRWFAFKGNAVDLAVGAIVGGTFHGLIDPPVKKLIMPLTAIIPGQRPYTQWQFTPRGGTVHVGLLRGDVAHFLLISAILFLFLVRFLGWLMRPEKGGEAAPP